MTVALRGMDRVLRTFIEKLESSHSSHFTAHLEEALEQKGTNTTEKSRMQEVNKLSPEIDKKEMLKKRKGSMKWRMGSLKESIRLKKIEKTSSILAKRNRKYPN